MTEVETYEPDWSGWLFITEVTVEDAAALTLNVDPDKRFDWEKHASAAQRAEFDRRVHWLNKWTLRRLRVVREPWEGYSWTVYLPEVVEFAKKAGWELPPPLLRLIEAENSDPAEPSVKIPKEEKKTDRDQAGERPARVSDNAWARRAVGPIKGRLPLRVD